MENYQAQNQYRPGAFQKGHLKIFFGYAAGVGKTYAMLEAAHQAQNRGIDVVVGYIERHTRPDTLALLEGLEQLPEKIVEYKGISLKELDLDAALQRRPNILLVDELAHSNAAGCRHSKRYRVRKYPGQSLWRLWRGDCQCAQSQYRDRTADGNSVTEVDGYGGDALFQRIAAGRNPRSRF